MPRTGKTQEDWIKAGQRLLIEEGIDAVRLPRLTEALGVSSGSFYHHFDNLDAYHAALAAYYGSEQAQRLFNEARLAVGEDPDALLREATAIFRRDSMRQLNIAMRAWAHRDARALAAVERYDDVLAERLDQIFIGMGVGEFEAKSRTLIMMGLAALETSRDLDPPFLQRWQHIRDIILKDAPGQR